ncbi:EspA/EspE family type VII secretion system effector [Mycobacterium sp. ITM-2016-00317]|uniref:EspA/EspE family type VII secretion system effector n=1 Tax=Mycobacterium sp. ITM-2016-00317 TaxID=2099694 RepID=UPI00287F63E5|nr:EspA/EspE family type VII secretion system effector [Mycobacterium sp. ITM-2016-00317]WNG87369.1 EspA/EspE family type VII secretion system effector [Mycobacterium sp. ITM-2016-00317]
MGLFDDLIAIGDGVRSGVRDVPSLIANVVTGDVHGAVTDGRNIIGDLVGVASGLENLGVSLGDVPRRYVGEAAKLADSKILSAAQLAIEAEKALTGSGDPDAGNGYRESAGRLHETVETLVDATPAQDTWDGAGADAYTTANHEHRRRTSAVQAADAAIARTLAIEADQVLRTRETLDDASQYLYDFGLSTSWMNFVPGLAAAKAAADVAAAADAMATTNTAMAILVKDAATNAAKILQASDGYDDTIAAMAEEDRALARDPILGGPCGALVRQSDDLAHLPRRIANPDEYEVPDTSPEWGPPAAPYGRGHVPSPGRPPPAPAAPAGLPTGSSAPRGRPAPADGSASGPQGSPSARPPLDMDRPTPERRVESR